MNPSAAHTTQQYRPPMSGMRTGFASRAAALWNLNRENFSVARKQPPVGTRNWSTAGAVTIEIVATFPTFKVRAERPVWLRYSDKLADGNGSCRHLRPIQLKPIVR